MRELPLPRKAILLLALSAIVLTAYAADRAGWLPEALRLPSHALTENSAVAAAPLPTAHMAVQLGQQVHIAGVIDRVESTDAVTRLIFRPIEGMPGGAEFQAVIFARERERFAGVLGQTDTLGGKAITVEGVLGEYKGRYEVILREPGQVRFP